MSLKQDFISYVENLKEFSPMPDNLTEYWNKFKGNASADGKPEFTDNGKAILKCLQKNNNVSSWKASDIATEMFVSSRTVSGAIRKLVSDGYVEKIGNDPCMYSITDKGINVKFEDEN